MSPRTIVLALAFIASLISIAFSDQGTPLRPGDLVAIDSSDQALAGTYALRADGSLIIHGLEPFNAAGVTIERLQGLISERLHANGWLARIKVTRAFNPRAPISFAGALKYTGEMAHRPGRRVSDVLALAEPTEFADLSSVTITDALDKVLIVNAGIPSFKGSTSDLMLRAGDRILVPLLKAPSELYVLGGVNKPGSISYSEEMDASKAIALAGGIAGHGNPNDVWVERAGKRLDGAPKLQRGDVIHVGLVEERRFVSVQGAVMRPGIVEFREGMTLSDVIQAAGGPTFKANLARVKVKSLLGQTEKTYDFAAIKKNLRKDVPLLASDIVDIPISKGDK